MKTFYAFDQNNSGGSFVVNDKLCHRVIIEADTEVEAINKAEILGVYFNGVDLGMDCDCCGDRWYKPHELKFPLEYSSFTKKEAEELGKTYVCEVYKEKSKLSTDKRERYGIIFPYPESYARYMADNYGWTDPDVRIFYKNDKIIEITGEKQKRKQK